MTPQRRMVWGGLAMLVVLLADQASKWWVLEVLNLPMIGSMPVLPVLNLTMVWNRGVTFGLLTADGLTGSLLRGWQFGCGARNRCWSRWRWGRLRVARWAT